MYMYVCIISIFKCICVYFNEDWSVIICIFITVNYICINTYMLHFTIAFILVVQLFSVCYVLALYKYILFLMEHCNCSYILMYMIELMLFSFYTL